MRSETSNRIHYLLDQLEKSDGPLADNDVVLVQQLLGGRLDDNRYFWPDRDLGAALRMVRVAAGYASVSLHPDDNVDAWAGPYAGKPDNAYAHSKTRGAPNVVLTAGLRWLLRKEQLA